MRTFAAACIGLGLVLLLQGGMDLFIHSRHPELGDYDSSMSLTDVHLAGRARAARRLAPIAIAVGAALLCCGIVLAVVTWVTAR